ncbi:glycoside hydrolase family 3 N-terminal domain-containing protein [Spirulina sp. CS-785/01]|uniref:glycoside hydrolase family 3 N-terminal domain-containing protein n=1 Tax=Spirulina sp. CS-785/01 TaxID=3021716 RepID=UPI00232D5F4A|nr:glycoside hydrolase family 3 N-terminal domain-containing protein [Spirulina sp. CS-785/01]MDB9315364.1 glycoside hydrolase family 3 N-terminal domain-containing protein [Spirulina sp. CS-785/01]
MAIGITGFQVLMTLALIVLSTQFRSPSLGNVRPVLLVVLLGGSPVLIFAGLWQLRRYQWRWRKFAGLGVVFLGVISLTITVVTQAQFYWQKYQVVFNAPVEQVAPLGARFMVGYKNVEDVIRLVEQQAIAGVFVTTRNIENRSYFALQKELEMLQTIRKNKGLSPLWIATDQEGGIVSRLSPPLTDLPPLSDVVAKGETLEDKKRVVVDYAKTQGQGLSDLGINVNFAPVVDLNQGVINPRDRYSQIYRRAISEDSTIVTTVARWYCETLAQFKVQCTIKHFPGLGRVETDTHVAAAELNTPIQVLEKEDWLPFREIMKNAEVWTMLSHVKLTALDEQYPVSFSQKVIQGLIREEWGYEGILITDDICMKAFYQNQGSIYEATKQALDAGVDFLLIAYDPDLYYPVMANLLRELD